MLTHWNKLLNTDCVVIRASGLNVYPIFRVGYTTLMSVCDKKYVNEQIGECGHIDVMIRNPRQRFVSGVNAYCEQNNLDVQHTWQLIKNGQLLDRHFTPQYIWLMHLSKYYKGHITIRPFDHIKQITVVHKNKSRDKKNIPVCEPFVQVDERLTEHYNQTVRLPDIIRKYKNVLS